MHIAAALGPHHGHLRPDQSLSLGTVERPCRNGRAKQERAVVPTLPEHCLQNERPPLHAGHRSKRGGGDRGEGVGGGWGGRVHLNGAVE